MKNALKKIAVNLDLTFEETQSVMQQIMTGKCTDAQIGAFLMGMRIKSESIEEITACAKVMRDFADKVEIDTNNVVDIVGTGGDGLASFNVSTASAFVIASNNCKVAKHGSRAVSGKTGAADLLEFAGVNLNLNSKQVAKSINEIGLGFMFAQNHHPAMKYVAKVRQELAIRTIFNILGPLTNPAFVKRQVVGVFSQALCLPLAKVLQELGSEKALVVHSNDGLDEISLSSSTFIVELNKGEVVQYTISPEDLGVDSDSLVGLTVNSIEESYNLIKDALTIQSSHKAQKAAKMIALNAGAALYVLDKAKTLKEGVEMAKNAIDSGLAFEKLEEFAKYTQQFK